METNGRGKDRNQNEGECTADDVMGFEWNVPDNNVMCSDSSSLRHMPSVIFYTSGTFMNLYH